MNVTEPFVLKRDILLIPCADLSEDVRGRIEFEEGDFTLSHRHGRALAQVIDGNTAALLALFREPRTIVDAVLENSRVLGKDPRAWLDELLPHFGAFVHNRVLVPAGSDEEQEVRPHYDAGASIGDWTIVRCASLVEDGEVYQLRKGDEIAALKIARLTTAAMRNVFENEIAILRHLDGSGIAPRLLEAGVHEERPYFIAEWISGVDGVVAAARRRHDRPALLDLCASIAEAYATLHERGVLHADIHSRNLMITEQGTTKVTLLDFGYSRFAEQRPRVGRGGMYTLFEPEYLAGREQGMHSSAAGEQYSLAALLYLLIAGKDYLDFRFEREEMVRQVLSDAPLSFAQRGVPPWPIVEAILIRALSKDPAQRFASIAEMAAQLASARDDAARESLETPVSAEAQEVLEKTLRSYARGGAMFVARYPAPRANINHGAAGAAIGLLRIAEVRGDAALLALADVWRSRAAALIDRDDAYYDTPGLTRRHLGEVSPYHTESGIHAAGAMIAAAMGDTPTQRRAITNFLRSSQRPCAELDLTLGRSGSLLATAMLLSISDELPEAAALREFGASTMREIWDELDARPPLADLPDGTYLGIAHGWAGYMYAALRWCAASGDALPARLVERLEQSTAFAIRRGRGAAWQQWIGSQKNVPGWCNGSAGQIFLFTLAHRMLGEERWLQLAEACARSNWDEPRVLGGLCCGSAGRAYALLDFYQHTGATEWLARARQLANHAASIDFSVEPRADTLWKGQLGAAALIADLASPETATMPFFGDTRALCAAVARGAAAGASRS